MAVQQKRERANLDFQELEEQYLSGNRAQSNRTERAYDYVLNGLVSGQYRAGERIDVAAIAKALNISRQPVMNALQQLSNEDLVQITPQVGCVAAVYSPEEWLDFRKFFASGEALITQLAAERATESEFALLRTLSKEIARVLQRPGKAQDKAMEYRKANQRFHKYIHRMARSPIIDRRMAALWDCADYYISTLGHSRAFTDRAPVAVDEHELICDALERRDGALARNLMEMHIQAQVGSAL